MSEETESTCEICHKPLSECRCVRVVQTKSEGEKSELEKTKAEKDELEAQLTTIALKSFEDEKNAFLSQITDEKKRASAEKMIGDDPDRLENAKMMTELISAGIRQAGGHIKGESDEDDDGTEKVPNAGVVRALPKESSHGKEAIKEQIDEYFAIISDPSKSQKEKDLANTRITELYSEFRRGVRESGKHDDFPLLATMECPKCQNVMHGNICYTCGYEIPKIQRGKPFDK